MATIPIMCDGHPASIDELARAITGEPVKPVDVVNHPAHYTSHPSGIECIEVAEHYGFCIGNAIKYLWRAGLKGDAIEDLKKAVWYINREISKRERSRVE